VDLVYGIPSVVALLVALGYVRRVARRERKRRVNRTRVPPAVGLRSLSQRSEMRAGEDAATVMEEIQRTHSGTPFNHPSATSFGKGRQGSTRGKR
jgi:hypothetical protein